MDQAGLGINEELGTLLGRSVMLRPRTRYIQFSGQLAALSGTVTAEQTGAK